MLLVQESLGQVVIPYGITIGNQIYDLLNDMGFLFIPFAAIFIGAFFVARAQGKDEGSPAVLAIKIAEQAFYSALAVMYFFMIPINQSSMDVSYKHFLCGQGITGTSVYEAMQNAPMTTKVYSQVVDKTPKLPIGWGVVNNLAVGTSESLSGAMTSCKSATAVQAKLDEAYIKVDNPSLEFNLLQFNQQCFSKAQDMWATTLAKGQTNTSSEKIFDRRSLQFFGTFMYKMYTQGKFTMEIDEEQWSGTKPDANWKVGSWGKIGNYSFSTKMTIPCEEAAQEYKSQILTYINGNEDLKAAMDRVVATNTILAGEEIPGQSPVTSSASDVQGDYIHQAFLDTIMGKRGIFETTPRLAQIENQAWYSRLWTYISDTYDSLMSDDNSLQKVMVYFGAGVELMPKAAEIVNLYIAAPIYVSLFLAIIYAATPLVVLLSGYSWRFVYNLILAHVFLAMIPYVLNISFAIVNIMLIFGESYYGGINKVGNVGSVLLLFMAKSVPLMTVTGWTMISGMFGLNLGAFITNIISTNGIAAGREGASRAWGTLKFASNFIGGAAVKGAKAAKGASTAKNLAS